MENPKYMEEEGMATHSSILAWRIPMDRGGWRATVHGVAESDMTEQLSTTQIFEYSTTYWSKKQLKEKLNTAQQKVTGDSKDRYLSTKGHRKGLKLMTSAFIF